jgi:L-amino acid N-acyltransferase YncA
VVEIRHMTPEDWPEVEAIYADGIATGDATFETEPPGWEKFDESRLAHSRLVATESGPIVGWTALSPTSARDCYAGSSSTRSTSRSTRAGEEWGRR